MADALRGDNLADPPSGAAAAAAAAGNNAVDAPHRPRPHWLMAPLQGVLGISGLTTLVLIQRQWKLQHRCDALAHAPHVPVDHLSSWWDKQQMLHSLRHSNALDIPSSAPLPPQYVAVTGRAACADPLLTQHTATPQAALWMQSYHIRRFFKLFPLTALKMYEVELKDAHCESRDFEIRSGNNAAASASNFSAAGQSTAAVPASSSSAPSSSSSSPSSVSVHVPSSLPCESTYLGGLVREVSDVTRDVTLSSTTFMEQLARGKLQVQERNIERIIPVGQHVTLVGWVHRDPNTGTLSVIQGGGAQPTHSSSSSGNHVHAAALLPDSAAYSYSSTSRPCILTHMSPSRVLEEESARASSNRRWMYVALGVTVLVGVALVGRWVWGNFSRQQELKRILYFHELRKERRSERRREKREREKRREAKKRMQAKELAAMQHAQLNFLQAAAAANGMTQAATLPYNPYAMPQHQQHLPPHYAQHPHPQQEGVPQYSQRPASPIWQQAPQSAHGYPSPAPAPSMRQSMAASSSPNPMQQQQAHTQQQQQWGASHAAASSRHSSSPFVADEAGMHVHPRALQQQHQQQHHARSSSHASSALAAPAPLRVGHGSGNILLPGLGGGLGLVADDRLDDEDRDDAAASDADAASSDDSSDDGAADQDGGDDCVICAERRADACLVQCGHMYTCTSCASKLSRCPICRCAVERVVKVFAQQM